MDQPELQILAIRGELSIAIDEMYAAEALWAVSERELPDDFIVDN